MKARQTLAWLREYESRNVTFIEPDGSWPMVWARAQGARVWDAAGKEYLDLTAAFGVAAAGHANPRVVRAGQRQMANLLHAMGDVHPHALKAQLARELSRLTFGRWAQARAAGAGEGGRAGAAAPPASSAQRPTSRTGQTGQTGPTGARAGAARGKTIFCNSGFEAVEAALKTARLATGKPGIVAFYGAYHGLGYGALNATHRDHFRGPFRDQLAEFGRFVPFPVRSVEVETTCQAVARLLRREPIGAVLLEPVQVRGGLRIPAPEFLPRLRQLCDERGALLLLDEIYTGFGRTGKWFACERSATIPDVICLGKALTGGFPLSACVGRAEVMDAAWPAATGEAIHTSTFLGHPVGCAMALAQIREIRARRLVPRSERLGRRLLAQLSQLAAPAGSGLEVSARGAGLLAGLELRSRDGAPATAAALGLIKAMLRQGFILLPEGEHANVIAFTPPLTIAETELRRAVRALDANLRGLRN